MSPKPPPPKGPAKDPTRAVQLAALALALGACALLVAEHFGALALPGCGPQSACARAAASVYGRLPGTSWPVSFVGAAWFAALLVWRLATAGGAPDALRWAVRAGALVSVGYTGLMAVEGYLCPYCLAVHAANLVLWGAVERSPRAPAAADVARRLAAPIAAALLVSVALGAADAVVRGARDARQEEELAASTAEVVARQGRGAPEVAPSNGSGAGSGERAAPFVGRYPVGPERAAVRVVVFSDYQCPDCRRVEQQLREIEARGLSVSISMKHYPMCSDCNPHTAGRNPHKNACWAARAAEAAGLLGGPDAFRALHRWLFDMKGDFTRPEIERRVAELGLDPLTFRRTIEGPETLARVRTDVEEAHALGIHFTPMVFLNGVELRGVFAEDAVRRAIEEVLASGPEPAGPEGDRPPPALDKLVGDWRASERHDVADAEPRWLGPADAPVEVVVWGGHRSAKTAELDALLRAQVGARDDVRYNLRHFPFETGCNPFVRRDGQPGACRAARAVEAAHRLGGDEAFQALGVWLFEHLDQPLDDAALGRAAAEVGLDPAELLRAMGPDVDAAIAADVQAGRARLYRGAIPTVYVDGRLVPRWRLGDADVLGAILDAAAR